MSRFDEQDLHRLVKHALDNGTAKTLAEARALFEGYSIGVSIDASVADRPDYQIALLTVVALARRVFLGGVRVSGALDTRVAVRLPLTGTLGDAIVELGGTVAPIGDAAVISIASTRQRRTAAFHVRTAFAGWRGGVVPADADFGPETEPMPLAAMLSAAIAVNEAFSHLANHAPVAGRRPVGLSLWDPAVSWLTDDRAPKLEALPSRLWLIGLGHLGQAYLWALGLLPYPSGGLELILQDTDDISRSTESTSILTNASMLDLKKTRVMADWAERRGFRTAIHERLLDASFRRQAGEPSVALCGVDNAEARRAFDQAGFPLVVEAGLGRGHRDFRTIRLHTLPGARPAAEIWKNSATAPDNVATKPAYQRLLAEGSLDQCGLTLLAGKAVGAPFVGAVAATLVVSEVLRLLHGAPMDAVLDLDLESLDYRTSAPQHRSFDGFNPGYVRAAP